jgi:hypothetical protein
LIGGPHAVKVEDKQGDVSQAGEHVKRQRGLRIAGHAEL